MHALSYVSRGLGSKPRSNRLNSSIPAVIVLYSLKIALNMSELARVGKATALEAKILSNP